MGLILQRLQGSGVDGAGVDQIFHWIQKGCVDLELLHLFQSQNGAGWRGDHQTVICER